MDLRVAYTALHVEWRMSLVGYVRTAHVRVSTFYFSKNEKGKKELNAIDLNIT